MIHELNQAIKVLIKKDKLVKSRIPMAKKKVPNLRRANPE